MTKRRKVQFVLAAVLIVGIGLAIWAFTAHQAENRRLEQQRAEAAKSALATTVVKDTYRSFLDLMQTANKTHEAVGVEEFINSAGGKILIARLRKSI